LRGARRPATCARGNARAHDDGQQRRAGGVEERERQLRERHERVESMNRSGDKV